MRQLPFGKIASLLLRISALGGRFVFIVVAAQQMTPVEFGIYGVIAASAFLINQIVGIEAYQTTLRQVALRSEDALTGRPAYGRFVALSAILSFLSGTLLALWFGWSPAIVALSGAIIALEYIGTEVTRILVCEERSSAAQISVSLRLAPWSFGWPIAMPAGIAPHIWPLEWVLASWCLCSFLGCLFFIPVASRYFAPMRGSFFHWYKATLRLAPMWMVVALCGRFLENGIRLIPAFLIDETTAGRYIYLANLASIGLTGLKAAIEPFWHVRLVRPETQQRARSEFAIISLTWVVFGSILSLAGLWGLAIWGNRPIAQTDWALLIALCVAAALQAMSQVPHYALYAAHADRIIMHISTIVLIGSIVICCGLTSVLGIAGTATGAVICCGVLLALKIVAVRRLAPEV